ncbi:MAG: hypothetical protein KBT20_00215 [Bacteroidales bacterium]|nr:hypothetical protein [Candidatus Liminaster caballi]
MKKALLIASAAVIAVSASAQFVASSSASDFAFTPASYKMAQKNVIMPKADNKVKVGETVDYSAVRQAIKNGQATKSDLSFLAPAQSSLYGKYIEVDPSDITETNAVELEAYEFEGTTYVAINGFGATYADILAEYDAEAGQLIANTQECYEHETYGVFEIWSIHEGDEEHIWGDITFTVQEDGMLVLDQAGWYIMITTGEYEGQCWALGYGTVMPKANGKATCTFSDNNWTGEGDVPCFVDFQDDAAQIYNATEDAGGCIVVDLNQDGTGSFAHAQFLQAGGSTTGDWYLASAWVDEEGYLNDYEVTDAKAFTPVIWGASEDLSKGAIQAGSQTAEQAAQGKYSPAYNVVLSEVGYWFGHWMHGLSWEWDNNATTGINNLKSEQAAKNATLFNLNGQKTNATKGLMIRGNKAIFVK